MKLFVQIISENVTQLSWDVSKAPGVGGTGWYEIPREPEDDEYVRYNSSLDIIEIKTILAPVLTSEEKEANRIAEVNRAIAHELPNILRLAAVDNGKTFNDLKAEIKAIDDEITIEAKKADKK